MKKNDWILIVTVAFYSFLFYKESAGINFVLFNLVLISALLIKDKKVLKSKTWLLTASGCVFSALCVAYYGNGLSTTTNIISLSLLSALSYSKDTSVVISLLCSVYSFLSAIIFKCIEWQQLKSTQAEKKRRKLGLIIVPFLITLVFFFMYKSSNVLFNDFTKNINLNFISGDWVLFTTGGFVLLTGFFYQQRIQYLETIDKNTSNTINPLNSQSIRIFGKELSLSDEEFTGKVLLALLNILLLVVNSLDIHFMFIDNQLPQGVTYSEFVHQGTGMLITSIILAIGIILFYFRGALNFSEKGNVIKWMAFLWIIQNAFMICSTLFRNNMYVSEYGLTYKRIGVYVYLILTLIGLVTTYIKIAKVKSNFFLFRVNGWAFYGVLVLASFVNWDRFISAFNINKAKQIQSDYLLSLSYTVLPDLYSYPGGLLDEKNGKIDKAALSLEVDDFERMRDKQLYSFLKEHEAMGWKSWYYDDKKTHEQLVSMNGQHKIDRLNLSFMKIRSMEPLNEFKEIQSINLTGNDINDIREISGFKELKGVNIQKNRLIKLNGIESLNKLEVLDIRQNNISDYSPLHKLKNLKKLYIDKNITNLQLELLQKELSETTIIKG